MSIIHALNLNVAEFLLGVTADFLKLRNTVDGVNREAEAIDFVRNGQLEGSVDIPLLLVAADVDASVRPAVSKPVDQPGISVEVEDDRLVGRKE